MKLTQLCLFVLPLYGRRGIANLSFYSQSYVPFSPRRNSHIIMPISMTPWLRASLQFCRIFLLAAAIASSPIVQVAAQTNDATPSDQAVTVYQALAETYRNNPQLLAARAQLRATDETLPLARSGFLPTVTFQGSLAASEQQQTISGFDADPMLIYPKSYSVSAQQNLFAGFRTVSQIKQAKKQIASSRESLRNVEQNVLLQAVTAYMDVIRDRAILNLRNKNIEVLAKENEASKLRLQVGEATRTDTAQSKARLSRARSSYAGSQGQLNASSARFNEIIGFYPSKLTDPEGTLPKLPATKEEAINLAFDNNPFIMLSQTRRDVSEYQIDIAKADLYPSLDIVGSFSEQVDNFSTSDDSTQLQIQARLSMPLYRGGASYARIRQARQNESRDRLQVAVARRQVRQLASSSWDRYVAALSRRESDLDQINANRIAFRGVSGEAELGLRTTLDILDAEQELLDSRVGLAVTERDIIVSAYTLLNAIGLLSLVYLDLPADPYDPEKNYRSTQWKFFGVRISDDKLNAE